MGSSSTVVSLTEQRKPLLVREPNHRSISGPFGEPATLLAATAAADVTTEAAGGLSKASDAARGTDLR